MTGGRPLVIAHRGASGHRPEHTVAAYELAIRQGADYLEPDVVVTRDGVLIVRHENELSTTTDIAARPELARLQTTKRIDGRTVRGWFAEDLTLEQVKSLRVRERLPSRSHAWDGQFPVLTLQEVLRLAKAWEEERGRPIGLYPETKHPTYFRSIGLPLEEPLLELLGRAGYDSAEAPVFIQSFESRNLRDLRRKTDLRLVQLLDQGPGRPFDLAARGDLRTYQDLCRHEELAKIRAYADAIACHKGLIVPGGPAGRLLAPTSLVADAHAQGLEVHAWTFRSEPQFLPEDYGGAPEREYEQFFDIGVDGVFTDFPDAASAVRERRTTPH